MDDEEGGRINSVADVERVILSRTVISMITGAEYGNLMPKP